MASNKELLDKIVALEEANRKKDTRLQLLEDRVKLLEESLTLKSNTIDVLKENLDLVSSKANRTEQYTMRTNLRITGVPAPKDGETNEEVMEIVKEISEDLGVTIADDDIFRAHRVGKIVKEKKKDGTPTGRKIQSIIVRFRSWDTRCQLYKSRPRKNNDTTTRKSKYKKRPQYHGISLDLSQHSRDLIDKANNELKIRFPHSSEETQGYAFGDINCNLRMRLPGTEKKFVYFSSAADLEKILSSL